MARHDPAFLLSAEWRAARNAYRRVHPRCEVPGCTHSTRHIDHIVARASGGAAFDPANLKALCISCHSRKTAYSEAGGFGPKRGGAKVRGLPGCDASGRPLDPAHAWNTPK